VRSVRVWAGVFGVEQAVVKVVEFDPVESMWWCGCGRCSAAVSTFSLKTDLSAAAAIPAGRMSDARCIIERMFDCGTYSRHGASKVLVFPDAHHLPSGVSESLIRQAVSLDVPPKLPAPVPLVAGGLAAMLRTDMPEAAVNEDRHLAPGEDDVGPHSDPCREVKPVVFAIPVAEPVQLAAELDLRFRPGPTIGPHVTRAPLVHRSRVGQARRSR